VKRKFSVSREAQAYIKNTISHTKNCWRKPKKEIMICILKRQQTKQKIWQLINKQDGKCASLDKKIELKTETGIVKNTQKVADVKCIFCRNSGRNNYTK